MDEDEVAANNKFIDVFSSIAIHYFQLLNYYGAAYSYNYFCGPDNKLATIIMGIIMSFVYIAP